MTDTASIKPSLRFRIKWRWIAFKKKHFGIKTPDQLRAYQSLEEIQAILNQAHFIQLKIRIDGEWREYEADYLKYLL